MLDTSLGDWIHFQGRLIEIKGNFSGFSIELFVRGSLCHFHDFRENFEFSNFLSVLNL